jgi:hypothetical protein
MTDLKAANGIAPYRDASALEPEATTAPGDQAAASEPTDDPHRPAYHPDVCSRTEPRHELMTTPLQPTPGAFLVASTLPTGRRRRRHDRS